MEAQETQEAAMVTMAGRRMDTRVAAFALITQHNFPAQKNHLNLRTRLPPGFLVTVASLDGCDAVRCGAAKRRAEEAGWFCATKGTRRQAVRDTKDHSNLSTVGRTGSRGGDERQVRKRGGIKGGENKRDHWEEKTSRRQGRQCRIP
jgi:hypothetical protein